MKMNICYVYLPGDSKIEILKHFYNKLENVFINYPEDKYLILGDCNYSDLPST